MTHFIATTRSLRGVDLSQFNNAPISDLNSNDPSALFVRIGGRRVDLVGDYSYNASTGALTGTIDGLNITTLSPAGRITVMGLRDLAIEGRALLNLLDIADGDGFFQAMSAGDDRMSGSKWNDLLNGGAGDDTLSGGLRQDTLNGGSGDDVLLGGSGRDVLIGGTGADRLAGGYFDDTLRGGAGQDTLLGGAGDDRLEGGADNDALRGGGGNDVFVFIGATGRDIVGDFTVNDTVLLGASYWTGGRSKAEFVDEFCDVRGEGILMSYGGNQVFFNGVTNLADFTDRLRTPEDILG